MQFSRPEPEPELALFGGPVPEAVPVDAAHEHHTAPSPAPTGTPLDPSVMAARVELFSHFGNVGPPAQIHATRPQPKKSATKAEVAAIQTLMDRAKKADAAAAKLENEAEILQFHEDKNFRAKEREAHAMRRTARGLKQEAMNAAVSAFGIDITHVKKLLYSDDTMGRASETEDDNSVAIGDSAFDQNPAWLASTIAHEAEAHVNLQGHRGRAYGGPQGRRLNEIQAYDWELTNAKRFGLSPEQIATIKRMRAHYLDDLSDHYKKRRAAGNYTMEPGKEEE
jgi:hypothetical protein